MAVSNSEVAAIFNRMADQSNLLKCAHAAMVPGGVQTLNLSSSPTPEPCQNCRTINSDTRDTIYLGSIIYGVNMAKHK